METKGKLYMILVGKYLNVRDNPESLGVDGRVILTCILTKSFGKVWSDLTQDRGKRLAVVKTVMNLRVS
jgi:hypothetical protein